MKGKVFIAWSGKNALAVAVKKIIEEYDYLCVVGGLEGSENGLYLGQVIIDEINRCNQAIFVVEKKSDGTISNNLTFELGYALARFNANKIYIFYVDIEENDKSIPSDLKGVWAEYIKSEGTDAARIIAEKFVGAQKHIIPGRKMAVVNDYYNIRSRIQDYTSTNFCSEYELAQYVHFFSQSAYLFNDEKEALETLNNLLQKLDNPSDELHESIRFGTCYLTLLQNIKNKDGILFVEREIYRRLKTLYQMMEEKVARWERDDFSGWFRMFIADAICYMDMLYAHNPDILQNRKQSVLEECIEYAYKCLEECEALSKNRTNAYFVELYKAFMYRNISVSLKLLDPVKNKQAIRENHRRTYEMRRELWCYYDSAPNINTKISESFEMEYFLALSEELEYSEDEDFIEDSFESCMDYIQKVNSTSQEKENYIRKIRNNLASVTG